jgi:hypothetical protein
MFKGTGKKRENSSPLQIVFSVDCELYEEDFAVTL